MGSSQHKSPHQIRAFITRSLDVVTNAEISQSCRTQRCNMQFLVRVSIWKGKIKLSSEANRRECDLTIRFASNESQQHDCGNYLSYAMITTAPTICPALDHISSILGRRQVYMTIKSTHENYNTAYHSFNTLFISSRDTTRPTENNTIIITTKCACNNIAHCRL